MDGSYLVTGSRIDVSGDTKLAATTEEVGRWVDERFLFFSIFLFLFSFLGPYIDLETLIETSLGSKTGGINRVLS